MRNKTLLTHIINLLFFLYSSVTNVALANDQSNIFDPNGIPESVKSNFPYKGVEFTDNNTLLRYYNSDMSETIKPLVVILGGSGCEGNFAIQTDGQALQSLASFLSDYLTDLRVILIDPPNIPRQFSSVEPGTSTDCPSEFISHYDLDYFVSSFKVILQDIKNKGWMTNKILLIASSDGTVVATQLLADDSVFSHALLISGGGASQVFDQINSALGLENRDKTSKDINKEVQQTIEQWNHIISAKKSDKTFYFGHPFSRWQTFGLASNLDLYKTNAQIYLVQGGQDQNVAASGFALLLAELVKYQKPFLAEFIPCGDHFLFCENEQEPTRLENVIHKAIDWFLLGDIPPDVIINKPQF